MSDQIKDQLKSFILGLAFPLALVVRALPYMDGAEHDAPRWGRSLTPTNAFGYGLWQVGIALCIHAFFYGRYDNHPLLKVTAVALGVISFFVGLYLQFS
jgi:hypothetical protein